MAGFGSEDLNLEPFEMKQPAIPHRAVQHIAILVDGLRILYRSPHDYLFMIKAREI